MKTLFRSAVATVSSVILLFLAVSMVYGLGMLLGVFIAGARLIGGF